MTYYRAKQLTFSGGRALIEPLAKTWGEDFSFKPSAGHQQREDRLFHKISEKRFKNKFWIVPGSFWQEARRLCGAEKVAKVQKLLKNEKRFLYVLQGKVVAERPCPWICLRGRTEVTKTDLKKKLVFLLRQDAAARLQIFILSTRKTQGTKKVLKPSKRFYLTTGKPDSERTCITAPWKINPGFFLQRNFQQLLKKELLTQASTRH